MMPLYGVEDEATGKQKISEYTMDGILHSGVIGISGCSFGSQHLDRDIVVKRRTLYALHFNPLNNCFPFFCRSGI